MFATEHDGRGPGGGQDSQNNPVPPPDANGNQQNIGTGVSWDDILNSETLARPSGTKYNGNNYGIEAGHSALPTQRMLSCPNFVPGFSGGSPRYNIPYAYNGNLAGGYDGIHYYGPYGSPVLPETPGTVIQSVSNDTWKYYKYWYGAKMTRFTSNQFLIIEFDYANSTITHESDHVPNGSVALGLGGAPFPYTTASGDLSFRHPYTKKANYLYFDGHVEPLTPKDNVGSDNRYYPTY